jgi:hypothetical protein
MTKDMRIFGYFLKPKGSPREKMFGKDWFKELSILASYNTVR